MPVELLGRVPAHLHEGGVHVDDLRAHRLLVGDERDSLGSSAHVHRPASTPWWLHGRLLITNHCVFPSTRAWRLVEHGVRRLGHFSEPPAAANPFDERVTGLWRLLRRVRSKEWVGFGLAPPDWYLAFILQTRST